MASVWIRKVDKVLGWSEEGVRNPPLIINFVRGDVEQQDPEAQVEEADEVAAMGRLPDLDFSI